MRTANYDPKPRFSETNEGYILEASFTFTGDAVHYLTEVQSTVNLKDWIWHIEFINGVKYYVITDKLPKKS